MKAAFTPRLSGIARAVMGVYGRTRPPIVVPWGIVYQAWGGRRP